MATTEKPLVDSELYVNDATVEVLRNIIEAQVRGSLRRSVLWPLLFAGIALIVIAAVWLIPREITTLMREDPIVEKRFSKAAELATEKYITDPELGKKAIQEQVKATINQDQNMQSTISTAADAAVATLEVQDIVQQQVESQLQERLDNEIERFLSTEEGRSLINEAVRQYFGSEAGERTLDAITAEALRSPEVRKALISDLDSILNQ